MKQILLAGASLLALALGMTEAGAVPTVFSFTGASTTYTVPTTGTYSLLALGARGGSGNRNSSPGGLGARSSGDFTLTAGDVLFIAAGGQGQSDNSAPVSSFSFGGGGGEGSWIFDQTTATLLAVAGGGGGGYNGTRGFARITTNGGAGSYGGGAGGTLGSGGGGGASGAGGGLNSAGGAGNVSGVQSGLGGGGFPGLAPVAPADLAAAAVDLAAVATVAAAAARSWAPLPRTGSWPPTSKAATVRSA